MQISNLCVKKNYLIVNRISPYVLTHVMPVNGWALDLNPTKSKLIRLWKLQMPPCFQRAPYIVNEYYKFTLSFSMLSPSSYSVIIIKRVGVL